MIKITNLNKVYKSKKKSECHAIKDISLTLPDSGLVFVLGKSGSGKSTLLNLIGGLDNMTSGEIEVNGNSLSNFKENDFCDYRNTHVGFIFQDYHLIDDVTIYENIALSLNLHAEDDREKVLEALKLVDLEGYEERFPQELSGGEQQRIAIARAIVKEPKVILADEPTGNLDSNTAKSIVELLKKLSKKCLILIVSHNVTDAHSYGDRVIELANGKIISDKTRNPEFLDEVILKNNSLIYPSGLHLSDSDIDLINNHRDINILKKSDKFYKTEESIEKVNKIEIESKKLSFVNTLKLSRSFLKSKVLSIILSAFMVSMIMVILALSETIVKFDAGKIIEDEMNKTKQNSILMNKVLNDQHLAELGTKYPVVIDENDIQKFYDAGYKGKIYPVYSSTLQVVNSGIGHGFSSSVFKGAYMMETFGTLIIDEDFLNRKFPNFEYAVKKDNFVDCGIIITDYVADSILSLNSKYLKKSYNDLLGEYFIAAHDKPRHYINGIIDTKYKERYQELFDFLRQNPRVAINTLYNRSDFNSFISEVYETLGYCFSLNQNFISDYKNTQLSSYPAHYKLVINDLLELNTSSSSYIIDGSLTATLKNANNFLANDWVYTTDIPQIPEGAKYIRVAYNSALDDSYGIVNEITNKDCGVLKFSNGVEVDEKAMKANLKDDVGCFISKYDNSIVELNRGAGRSMVSDFVEIPEGAQITEIIAITIIDTPFYAFYDENKKLIEAKIASYTDYFEELESTVIMSIQKYNELFGTDYNNSNLDKFIPHKVKLAHYDRNDLHNENPLFETEVTIGGLRSTGITFLASNDIYQLFKKDAIRVYSLYFDGKEGLSTILDEANKLNYEHQSYAIEGIHTMTKAVTVFVPIFELVLVFLCVAIVFILLNFSSKMIKDKMHEIGILKALGMKNSSLLVIFGLQVALIAISTCIMATIGYLVFIDLANDVLIESLKRLAPSRIVIDLDFLTFKPLIALINCVLTFGLAIVSLVVPMFKIKAIKPVKIIKAKE